MSERRNADISRLLVRRRGVGMLSTAMAEGGAPYGSLVTYACDQQGQPLFLFSGLSDHTKNIAADARVVFEAGPAGLMAEIETPHGLRRLV